jgi:Mn-dependent DtxR family transcriptional regulator
VAYISPRGLTQSVETLQRLTRAQVEALRVIRAKEGSERGVSLKLVASTLGVSSPSALGRLTPLETLGLVERHRGKSRLTAKGHSTLEEYQRHHRLAEALFGSLGLPPSETCTAAREIDLALSHRTIEEICRAQQHPAECPHGEPIAPCRGSSRAG